MISIVSIPELLKILKVALTVLKHHNYRVEEIILKRETDYDTDSEEVVVKIVVGVEGRRTFKEVLDVWGEISELIAIVTPKEILSKVHIEVEPKYKEGKQSE